MKNCFSIFTLLIAGSLSSGLFGQVKLTRIDGSQADESAVTIDNGMLVSGSSKVDLNELRVIDFGKPIKPAKSRATISLLGGGSLGATALVLEDETFVLQNVAGEIKLGVDAVTQIKFKSEDLPLYDQAKPKEDLDQLFVKIKDNYQTVPGIIDTISESEVVFIYDEDTIKFKTEDVFGLILAQGADKVEAEVNGVVVLTEGSRLSCLVKGMSANEVSAVVGGVADVVIPTEVVSRIEIRSNRLAFLSDLDVESVKFADGSVFVRPLQKDKNISGGKLVLRDRESRTSRTFAKGLGTKSGMSLVYKNNGFDRFVAVLGIDASTNGNGICNVKVIGDGRELMTTELTGVDAPKPVDLDISGVDKVELAIEFGSDFLDLSDHVNWCDARFVKKSN